MSYFQLCLCSNQPARAYWKHSIVLLTALSVLFGWGFRPVFDQLSKIHTFLNSLDSIFRWPEMQPLLLCPQLAIFNIQPRLFALQLPHFWILQQASSTSSACIWISLRKTGITIRNPRSSVNHVIWRKSTASAFCHLRCDDFPARMRSRSLSTPKSLSSLQFRRFSKLALNLLLR